MADIYKKSGINTTIIGMKSGFDIFGALRFRKFLIKEQFDIVHIQMPNPLILAIALHTAPHVICHIRWGKAAERKGIRRKLFSYFFKRVDKVITVCDHIKKVLVTGYGVPAKQIQTIHNANRYQYVYKTTSGQEANIIIF